MTFSIPPEVLQIFKQCPLQDIDCPDIIAFAKLFEGTRSSNRFRLEANSFIYTVQILFHLRPNLAQERVLHSLMVEASSAKYDLVLTLRTDFRETAKGREKSDPAAFRIGRERNRPVCCCKEESDYIEQVNSVVAEAFFARVNNHTAEDYREHPCSPSFANCC